MCVVVVDFVVVVEFPVVLVFFLWDEVVVLWFVCVAVMAVLMCSFFVLLLLLTRLWVNVSYCFVVNESELTLSVVVSCCFYRRDLTSVVVIVVVMMCCCGCCLCCCLEAEVWRGGGGDGGGGTVVEGRVEKIPSDEKNKVDLPVHFPSSIFQSCFVQSNPRVLQHPPVKRPLWTTKFSWLLVDLHNIEKFTHLAHSYPLGTGLFERDCTSCFPHYQYTHLLLPTVCLPVTPTSHPLHLILRVWVRYYCL